ncbi:hypothetical protein EDD21DRAFT_357123, partial [Dissophora ornata]
MRLITIGLSAAAILVLSKVRAQDVAPDVGPNNAAAVDTAGDDLISAEGLKGMDNSVFPSLDELAARATTFAAFAADVAEKAPTVVQPEKTQQDKKPELKIEAKGVKDKEP